jgi:hypothetical protein
MRRKLLPVLISFTVYFTAARKVFAATSAPSSNGLGCGGGMGGVADLLCTITSGDTAKVGAQLNKTLSGIVGFLTIIGGLWFFIQFILAGYAFLSAAGDKSKVAEATQRITNALIGLFVVVAAWVIVGILGKLVGLDILNPGAILQTLSF